MRGLENDYPQERGMKKAQWSKYLIGGGALFLMIGMIWFPLLLFALGSTVGDSNLPKEVSLSIRIGSYAPIYSMTVQENMIIKYNDHDYVHLRNMYATANRTAAARSASTFLDNYKSNDVAAVKLTPESGQIWSISPPDNIRYNFK